MKASELIDELKAAMEKHGDIEVITEGCDCFGSSTSIKHIKDYMVHGSSEDQLIICRGDGL